MRQILLTTSSADSLLHSGQELLSKCRFILIGGQTSAEKNSLAHAWATELNAVVISGDNWALPEHALLARIGRMDLESPAAYDLADLVR